MFGVRLPRECQRQALDHGSRPLRLGRVGTVLAFMAQFGVGRPGPVNLLAPLAAIVLAACIGGLALAVLGRVVPRFRRALRSRIGRRRRRRSAASAELRARALMDELCPYGWRAQITLFTSSEDPLRGTREGQRDRVAVDWTAFEDRSSRVTVVRRVWAASISEALDAMVADRRTDETLQHVEQHALAEGVIWPDD
jgi:hypothetical protein